MWMITTFFHSIVFSLAAFQVAFLAHAFSHTVTLYALWCLEPIWVYVWVVSICHVQNEIRRKMCRYSVCFHNKQNTGTRSCQDQEPGTGFRIKSWVTAPKKSSLIAYMCLGDIKYTHEIIMV